MNINVFKNTLMGQRQLGIWDYLFPKKVKRWLRKKSTALCDSFFFACVDKLNVEEFIECGANEASASKMLSGLGVKSLAIEANPETFKSLTQATKDNYQCINIGLGDKSGTLSLHIPKGKKTAGNASFLTKNKSMDYDLVEVKVSTLDDVLKENQFGSALGALWIDVEGFSKQVLAGAKNYLSNPNLKIIKIEVESYESFKGQSLAEEINSTLVSFNFEPVYCDCEYNLQFNVIYLKRDSIDGVASEIEKYWNKMKKARCRFFNLFD